MKRLMSMIMGLPLLAGCAWPGPVEPLSVTAPPKACSPLVAWVAQQPVGSSTVLGDPLLGTDLLVRVESSYRAASGLACRRARVAPAGRPGPGEPVAVCNRGGEDWFLAPRVWGGVLPGDGR